MEMIKFKPLLKQTLWGGDRLAALKRTGTQTDGIGESWEVSGVKGSESIVAEGRYKGMSLTALLTELKGDLVGKKNYERYGNEFPLLAKFIDARQDLSIQVHPNDEVARRQGHPHGKTEMWYCIGGGEGCEAGGERPSLYCGLRHAITPGEYAAMVEGDTITQALMKYDVRDGDVFFIPGGRIHSIGAGCFVAEIQQTSDVTYRIYDFGRRDRDGRLRELHTREAAESIDYTVLPDYRTAYRREKNTRCEIVRCPHFTTAVYDIDMPVTLEYGSLDSFVVIMCLCGSATIDADGRQAPMRAGETILLPATAGEVKVEGKAKFLETFV